MGVVDEVGGRREVWERGDEAGLLCPAGRGVVIVVSPARRRTGRRRVGVGWNLAWLNYQTTRNWALL